MDSDKGKDIVLPGLPDHSGVQLTPAQQAAMDAARTQAKASEDATEVVYSTVGTVLCVGSVYKARLLHSLLTTAYVRGAGFGAVLALERLVGADEQQVAALAAEEAEHAPGFVVVAAAETLADDARRLAGVELTETLAGPGAEVKCQSVSSIDGVCTACGKRYSGNH